MKTKTKMKTKKKEIVGDGNNEDDKTATTVNNPNKDYNS